MKKVLILIALIISTNFVLAGAIYPKQSFCDQKTLGIPNGWYKATVEYYNYNTGTRSTYTLKVKVMYDRVVAIDFGNGGTVHDGYNNENYVYGGGYLDYVTDYNTQEITSATATVTITDTSGVRSFKILIA